jgi:hypothetical protein
MQRNIPWPGSQIPDHPPSPHSDRQRGICPVTLHVVALPCPLCERISDCDSDPMNAMAWQNILLSLFPDVFVFVCLLFSFLPESEPQFVSTFEEQVLDPGSRISLKW